MRLMWMTLVKNSPAIGPFLPSTRPAPDHSGAVDQQIQAPERRMGGVHCRVDLGLRGHVAAHERCALANGGGRLASRSFLDVQHGDAAALRTMWRATALPRPEAPPVMTARASLIFM